MENNEGCTIEQRRWNLEHPYQRQRGEKAHRPTSERPEPLHHVSAILQETAQAVSRRIGLEWRCLATTLDYWRWRCPPQTEEDTVQDVALVWLQERPLNGAVAFGMARHLVGRKWRAWHTRQHLSIEALADEAVGATMDDIIVFHAARWTDYLVGALDCEAIALGNITAGAIWGLLPPWVRTLVRKRLEGENVNGHKSAALKRWAWANAERILAATDVAAPVPTG